MLIAAWSIRSVGPPGTKRLGCISEQLCPESTPRNDRPIGWPGDSGLPGCGYAERSSTAAASMPILGFGIITGRFKGKSRNPGKSANRNK
jgi:hypothetical protein